MVRNKFLACPGRAIDPSAVALRIAELSKRYLVKGLAFDRWRINDLLREFDRLGLQAYQDGEKGAGLRLVAWGQGYKDMAPAIDALERAVMERHVALTSFVNNLATINFAARA